MDILSVYDANNGALLHQQPQKFAKLWPGQDKNSILFYSTKNNNSNDDKSVYEDIDDHFLKDKFVINKCIKFSVELKGKSKVVKLINLAVDNTLPKNYDFSDEWLYTPPSQKFIKDAKVIIQNLTKLNVDIIGIILDYLFLVFMS